MLHDNFSNPLYSNFIFKQKPPPVFQNKVYATQVEAEKATSGQVTLVQSTVSGFIFNKDFDNDLMVYDKNYQNEQANSPTFQQHLHAVFELLMQFGVREKKVVEIGCGKGHFLEILRTSHIDAIGFDPTYEGDKEYVVKEYFSEKSNISAQVIILRHTLEHIPSPFAFLHTIAKANHYQGMVFIEVPTFDWIVQKKAFWDVFYEHCNYFTEASLAIMFNKSITGSFFGGQYIYVWADLKDLKDKIEENLPLTNSEPNFIKQIQHIQQQLNESENVAIWGAGAKGSTFLNLLDNNREKVKYVIDINPAKQNKFIAGTGHPIYSPAMLNQDPVQTIWIMNENYIEEIKTTVNNNNIHFLML
jgi:hypothetical protein